MGSGTACAPVSRSTYDPNSGRGRPKQGRKAKREMEKARAMLSVGEEESERVAGLDVRPHRAGHAASFYEGFATRGLRVDCIRPGFVSCTFKVPPRLTDAGGNLSPGAIANLVDEVGAAVIHSEGHHMKLSVDMSISYMSPAKVDSLARSRCFHGKNDACLDFVYRSQRWQKQLKSTSNNRMGSI
ncbi:thioesterase [Musa troglodytarum]|uniref:Thioesterase n=1 Tax=Musa troglodytarum TaxID=320322 RepID=A0A9E7K6J4_9LILI|nr:thioesterase [Musa troglodytarum]